jgi:hypothetical protein
MNGIYARGCRRRRDSPAAARAPGRRGAGDRLRRRPSPEPGNPDRYGHQHRPQGDQGPEIPGAIAIILESRKAYVANSGGDHVTPVNTVTNRAGKAIAAGPTRTRSRSPRTGRPRTSSTSSRAPLRRSARPPTPRARRSRSEGNPRDRDHPGRQDCLRGQLRLGTVTPISTATNKPGTPIDAGFGLVAIAITP